MSQQIVDSEPTPRRALELSQEERESLWAETRGLARGINFERLAPDELVDIADQLSLRLPSDLRSAVTHYRQYAPDGDVVLLRGLFSPSGSFPDTPSTPWGTITGDAQNAALILLSITVLLGEPFNYASLYRGRIVQSMVPVRSMEFTQTSQSSEGMLDWHCEDSFREDRCDYAGLICIRGNSAAFSKYAQVRDVRLPRETLAILREDRFGVGPDPAHELEGEVRLRWAPIITGPESRPEIAYDTHHIHPAQDDKKAQAALILLGKELNRVAVSHVMERGDLLLFDNKRVVHARTPFEAKFDGTDRWLMRTMICGSALNFRRWGTRVPE